MALLKTQKGRDVIKHVTLKNVKTNIGHNLGGLYADFYLDGKKIGYINDDGWGGGAEVSFDSKSAEAQFKAFLKCNKVAQIMIEDDWAFIKDVSEITLEDQVDEIVTSLINQKEEEKTEKKIQKDCEKGIYIRTEVGYHGTKFKIPLKSLVLMYKEKGVEIIQKAYDKLKLELEDGEYIANKNLEELGIKL